MINTELGHIQIFFGQIVDIDDPLQLCRCKVAIQGKTDKIEKEKLPWYFSWNGVHNLPIVGDSVPVLIFDGNISTGFYGSVLVTGSVETAGNYKNYVEIFKKRNGDADAGITYTISEGIKINNGNVGINVDTLKLSLFCGNNKITVSPDSISLGNNGLEPMLMGDKTIEFMHEFFEYLEQLIKLIFAGFQNIMISATPSPFTAPIGAGLATYLSSELQMQMMLKMLKSKLNTLQSTKTFNS